uniref:hypothetical protein n=1 Tax=Daedaleopsis nitida TaxID=1140402 RepID=UPI0030E10AD9
MNEISIEKPKDKISIYNVIGLFIAGIFTIGVVIISIDCYYPKTFYNVPIIQPFVDSVYIITNTIKSYFKSGTIDPSSGSSNIFIDSIQRTSSGKYRIRWNY